MKALLRTLDVLRTLENARSANITEPALITETIARCQDLIAYSAGCKSRAEWASYLLKEDSLFKELSACKDELETCGFSVSCGGLSMIYIILEEDGAEADGLISFFDMVHFIISKYPSLSYKDYREYQTCVICADSYSGA